LGIDWNRYNPESDVIVLKTIFGQTPKLLLNIQPNLLDAFRLGAGMLHLWGESSARKWFGEMPATGIHLDADTCIRMLVFFGIHQRSMSDFELAGIKTNHVRSAAHFPVSVFLCPIRQNSRCNLARVP
jgi:hypothetical protein